MSWKILWEIKLISRWHCRISRQRSEGTEHDDHRKEKSWNQWSLLLSDQRRFFALGSLFQPLDFRRSFSAEASRPLAPLVVPSHNDGFVAAVELCKKHHSPVPIPPNDSVWSNVRGQLLNCCSPNVDDSVVPRGSVWLTQPCSCKKIHDKLVSNDRVNFNSRSRWKKIEK